MSRHFVSRRRTAIVVGSFVLVALSAGATSVFANGFLGRGTAHVPVPRAPLSLRKHSAGVVVGHSVKNDVSRPLRLMPRTQFGRSPLREANPNPRPVVARRPYRPDRALQTKAFATRMPATTLNFDGIVAPGVSCFCAPPDTNGEVGLTQYVQMVNTGFQVFDKATGASLLGPLDINTVWSGFGGFCAGESAGDPVVVYDQLANRWVISQFAGPAGGALTDECIAVSTGYDATGTWNRYDFHLGSDFFDYPKLGVWPDAYYMATNVFDSGGNSYLGPQPFAFDRAAMLAGNPATFVTTRQADVFASSNDTIIPADVDGTTPPPAGAPEPFLMSGTALTWKLWRFHVNFSAPATSTFSLGGNLTPTPYTVLCPNDGDCVPQSGTGSGLDALGDRAMFRLAYRNFGDHESLVGNQTVDSSGVAGIRWYELNHVTSGAPGFAQQSTYQPDTTWRWMGSAAMDRQGDLALGFSASSAAIHPEIRYAGRLAGDTPNTLAQGEATLHAGAGSQNASTHHRWGDYSDMTVDPIDDCTFWYTQEYYNAPNSAASWQTRIGSFKFAGPSPTGCNAPTTPALTMLNTADAPHVSPGAQIGFNLALFNRGTDPATGIAVTDNLPGRSGIDWSVDVAHSDLGWSIIGSPPNEVLQGPATINGGKVSHVHVTSASASGSCLTYTNAASFSSSNGGSGSASATTGPSCLGVTVAKAGSGAGTVTSSPGGITCGAACSVQFGTGTAMTLSATPAAGSDFSGWSGAGCAGAGLCTFVLDGAKSVTATFTLQKRGLTVAKKGNGRGTVTSSPGGIGCPSACLAQFFYGTLVTLTAKPTPTSVFSGWGGACAGTSTCSVSMTADRAATATFRAKCVVPKLVGLTLKKARARIKAAHCTVGKITRKRSSRSKSGKVLAQKPKPGRKLAPAAKVSLVVGRP